MLKKLLKGFSIFHLIIIALMAGLGVATKPIVVPLAHMITGPLYIPGGVIAGGFYMLWLVLGAGIIKKRGAATLISTVQAIMMVSLGIYGTHGIVSFFTYIIPGLAMDTLYLFFKDPAKLVPCFLAGIVANLSGTFLVNIVFFRLPIIPLILALSSASLSGGIGGIIAYSIIKQFKKFDVL
ncbi:MAG: ECF transporter S component [Halanaerobiales bacterium]|nr:ECF transporter S component [Halanaerobiales bacterium]